MDAIFRKEGQSLDYTPVSAVSAGDVIALQNNFYGIAKLDIAANELGTLAVTGIYQVAKPAGVINFGAILYWNVDTKQVQTTPIDNAYFGRAAAAAADADETVLAAVNACNIGTVSAPEAQATPAVTQNVIADLTATDPTVTGPATDGIVGTDYATEAAAIKAAIEQNDTNVDAVKVELVKLIDDLGTLKTAVNAAKADLATAVTALTTAGLFK